MPRKLRFRWISPFWVTKEFNGSYQLGILARELLSKWVNGFQLKPYKGRMPEIPFKEPENPRSTKGQATTWDAPVETRDALTPTDIVEPAWPYGHVVHELIEKKTRVGRSS